MRQAICREPFFFDSIEISVSASTDWDQRKAEAQAAGLAVAAILQAVGLGTAVLVVHCVESAIDVYAKVPRDAATALTEQRPGVDPLPVWRGHIAACPVTLTTH